LGNQFKTLQLFLTLHWNFRCKVKAVVLQ
jgi:hypothetical protein